MTKLPAFLVLPPNPVPVYYRGGASIAAFRNIDRFPSPEDWVGSTTQFPSHLTQAASDGPVGISPTDAGPLNEVVAASPDHWMGRDEGSPALLVKLLDAGERLPVHWHPDDTFAIDKVGAPNGKAEAWVILSPEPTQVWLGLRPDVSEGSMRRMIDAQDAAEMLAAMHEVTVRNGDVILVPPGIAHAIGEGTLLLELQQPSSLSALAEHVRLGLDEQQATFGLGWTIALTSLDLNPDSNDTAASIASGAALQEGLVDLLPEADRWFRCCSIRQAGVDLLVDRWTVVVCASGTASITTELGAAVTIKAGDSIVLPAASGDSFIDASGAVFLCQPPRSRN